MSPDELLAALNRLATAVKENTDEVRRLREEFQKLSASAPRKDALESRIEGLAPLVADLLRGGKKRGRG